MEKYVAILNNATQIDSAAAKGELERKARSWFNKEFLVYTSHSFAACTGYAKTVHEEIELVLTGHKGRNISIWEIDNFVEIWELKDYLDYEIWKLSGGWRKYLGIALFTNQRSFGKIYFDAIRHLSSNRLRTFMSNLDQSGGECTVFFEYDVSKLLDLKLTPLYDHSDRFSLEEFTNSVLELNGETNYAQIGTSKP